jgi:hypothetical protein
MTAVGRALGWRIFPPPGGRLPALRTRRATASAADSASSTATLNGHSRVLEPSECPAWGAESSP